MPLNGHARHWLCVEASHHRLTATTSIYPGRILGKSIIRILINGVEMAL